MRALWRPLLLVTVVLLVPMGPFVVFGAQFEAVMGVKSKLMHKALKHLKAAREVRDAGGYATRIYASSIQFDGEQAKKAEKLLNEHVRPYVDEHYFLPLYGMSLRSAEIEQQIGYKPTHGNMGRVDEATGLPNRPPLPCWSLFCEAHSDFRGGVAGIAR